MEQRYTSQVIDASYPFQGNLYLLEIAAKRDQQRASRPSIIPTRPKPKAACTWWKSLQDGFISSLRHGILREAIAGQSAK